MLWNKYVSLSSYEQSEPENGVLKEIAGFIQ